MSTPNQHPETSQLEAMSAGKDVAADVIEHVAECQVCKELVAEFERNNNFLSKLIVAAKAADENSRRRKDAANTAAIDAGLPADILAGVPNLPGYEGLVELHRGGQGVVFKARQIATKRDVAVKMPLAGTYITQKAKLRFEREIELVAQLQHPNIVTIHDSGITPDGRYYIVMELVNGVTLDRFLRTGQDNSTQSGRQRQIVILRLFEKIAAAVQHAHARGIVHRDLKPGNILVDNNGEPRVVDFGLARRGPWDPETSPTIIDEFQGTPAYASPEQVGGDPRAIDIRTDVYSIGVMLYRAVTSHWPYAVDGSLSDQIRNIKSAAPLPPSRRVRGITSDLDTVMLTALAKERERRYQSAGALASDLRNVLEDKPISARPASVYYVIRKAIARRKVFASFVGAGAISVAVTAGAWIYTQQESARAAQEVASAQSAAAQLANRILARIGEAGPLSGGQRAFALQALSQASSELDNGLAQDSVLTYVALRRQLSTMFASVGDRRAAVYQLQSALALLRASTNTRGVSQSTLRELVTELSRAQRLAGMYDDAAATLQGQLNGLAPNERKQTAELYIAISEVKLASGDSVAAAQSISDAIERGGIFDGLNEQYVWACDLWSRAAQATGDVAAAQRIEYALDKLVVAPAPIVQIALQATDGPSPVVDNSGGSTDASRAALIRLRCGIIRSNVTYELLAAAAQGLVTIEAQLPAENDTSSVLGAHGRKALAQSLTILPSQTQPEVMITDTSPTPPVAYVRHAEALFTFADVSSLALRASNITALPGTVQGDAQSEPEQLRAVGTLLDKAGNYAALLAFSDGVINVSTGMVASPELVYWHNAAGKARTKLGEHKLAAQSFAAALRGFESLDSGVVSIVGVRRDDVIYALINSYFVCNQDDDAIAVSAARMATATGEVTFIRRATEHVKLLNRCERAREAHSLGNALLRYIHRDDNEPMASLRADLELATALAFAKDNDPSSALVMLATARNGLTQTGNDNPMFARITRVRESMVLAACGQAQEARELLSAQISGVQQSMTLTGDWGRLTLETLAQLEFIANNQEAAQKWLQLLD